MKPQKEKNQTSKYAFYALLAALLFGLNAPFAKLLLVKIPPLYMAALLYLGAALGMSVVYLFSRNGKERREASLGRQDVKWAIIMVLIDIAAPVLLMYALTMTTAANASLLYNFEMVATALIAMLWFHESVGRRMWISLGIITLASFLLSLDSGSTGSMRFSTGSLLVLAGCFCWGLENNCTRNLSAKDPIQIVMVKGFGAAAGAFLLAFATRTPYDFYPAETLEALLLGFVSYGLSIFFYVKAQRHLGAARTSMYYAAAPFMGVILSLILLGETPGIMFAVAFLCMAAGVVLALKEKHKHRHVHQQMQHEHSHNHADGHHTHTHEPGLDPDACHTHMHTHEEIAHTHEHSPDIHHRHAHEK